MTDIVREIYLSPYQMMLRRLIALTDGFKNYELPPHRVAFDRWLHPEPVKRSCDTAIARFDRSPRLALAAFQDGWSSRPLIRRPALAT